ncbi:MotA/TolQ/ExbB proton channel family protein [Methanobrevibacter boviskoreani]|jgi:biopolymer transport protein ExbB/TolQ|uniref:MotA/TolQ/ExbB proton channel family protein n=1 Tax=Methanobrevibacter boviskoreani TaxID=1348249 RepID=UPI0005932931|nr:MotA/TolQ/ExbB proton channel family protein [Methanobrevibacter boviskoreani]MCI6774236.1 MotA/TolQ/ExbB proton channel family protein [Methanobrevibacter boviskoreani]MCI6931219.1 MotA/TolQ/ExbB proton channel family protein [Methanobrevibacter boviskoreani]
MAVSIPGGSFLTSLLNVISQSLLIPVLVILLICAFYVIIALGSLIAEYTSRKIVSVEEIDNLIENIDKSTTVSEAKGYILKADINKSQKKILNEILDKEELSPDSREVIATRLVEQREEIVDKRLRRTDIIVRVGPTLGLMGTLIPLGSGLAALKTGDINTLADSLIVAFDTTVVGVGAGALAYFISKIRGDWYEEYLNNLDTLTDSVLSFMKNKL